MSLKSIFFGLVVEEGDVPMSAIRFALDLAAENEAHLRVGLAAPKFEAATGLLVQEIQGMLNEINARRHERAVKLAEDIRTMSVAAGVALTTEVAHAPYYDVREKIVQMARVSDVILMGRSGEMSPSERDFAEDVLFNSGRPLMIVPQGLDRRGPFAKIVVAWDGGARAARAVGDAMSLLSQATAVEVVTVAGDPDKSTSVEGAQIAQHLSRHCRNVSATELPRLERSTGQALRSHAMLARADLLVMGGYAHSRLRQFVLGGVTSDMLAAATFPILMSY